MGIKRYCNICPQKHPPSYICYSPTGLSLPLPLIYRRAQLRKFIDAPSHITQACALTADFSEGLDLTKVKLTNLKMYSPASVQSHRCYPRLLQGWSECRKQPASLLLLQGGGESASSAKHFCFWYLGRWTFFPYVIIAFFKIFGPKQPILNAFRRKIGKSIVLWLFRETSGLQRLFCLSAPHSVTDRGKCG